MSNIVPTVCMDGLTPLRLTAYTTTTTFYLVTCWSDDGITSTAHHFLNKDIAELAAVGRGGWGHNASIDHVCKDVVVYVDSDGRTYARELGKFVDLTFKDTDDVKARALAKLTAAEKIALGIRT